MASIIAVTSVDMTDEDMIHIRTTSSKSRSEVEFNRDVIIDIFVSNHYPQRSGAPGVSR